MLIIDIADYGVEMNHLVSFVNGLILIKNLVVCKPFLPVVAPGAIFKLNGCPSSLRPLNVYRILIFGHSGDILSYVLGADWYLQRYSLAFDVRVYAADVTWGNLSEGVRWKG